MKGINRRSLLGAGAGLLVNKRGHVHAAPLAPGTPNTTAGCCSLVVETANRFLAGLGPDQRAKATFKFEDDERMNWHFFPKERKGLPLREMPPYQKHLASALLSAGLSRREHQHVQGQAPGNKWVKAAYAVIAARITSKE